MTSSVQPDGIISARSEKNIWMMKHREHARQQSDCDILRALASHRPSASALHRMPSRPAQAGPLGLRTEPRLLEGVDALERAFRPVVAVLSTYFFCAKVRKAFGPALTFLPSFLKYSSTSVSCALNLRDVLVHRLVGGRLELPAARASSHPRSWS